MSNKGKTMAMLPMILGIAGGALTLIISIIVVNKVIDSTSLIAISRFLVFINTESNRYFYLLLAVFAGILSICGGICSCAARYSGNAAIILSAVT